MGKKVVLVIDDDDMNLQIAKMVLEKKLPCEVIGVDNGVEGIEVLKSRRVNLVLLDIMMPDFDGIETLQEIRGDEQIKDVPVMMLTASGDIENIQKVGLLGVKDYIKKPFMPADLVSRVEKKLAEGHSEEILLIGDDKKTLQNMQKVIEENFPHEALIAASYDDVTKILREREPILIIACADMKFVDGFKILAFIAGDEKFKSIPFALTTPEKITELMEKINQPEIDKRPKIEEPPIVEEVAESVIARAEKKKLANVVTNLIGYELDLKI